ncbi:unnamed protein product [Zymoseptoria tritici ST99CH_1A5]|uniref:Uncharacterized protein n=2 Tax=Zymoseptoria tritici TaxID=1047171 RepID=A0A2H1H0H3_ZYMTR|nr:unnamed protein product [Zymoseptoria tritici ST99CH_1E4]SMY28541.1 unnamed protein product [Zymoseptoria tritici ST99CH_1A5]
MAPTRRSTRIQQAPAVKQLQEQKKAADTLAAASPRKKSAIRKSTPATRKSTPAEVQAIFRALAMRAPKNNRRGRPERVSLEEQWRIDGIERPSWIRPRPASNFPERYYLVRDVEAGMREIRTVLKVLEGIVKRL